jgi:hypothetical protein
MVNITREALRAIGFGFNRSESARILGIPATTLANWNEELGIVPSVQDAGIRGVSAMYSIDDLFRAAIAKRQLQGGLSKKCARATAGMIAKLLAEAGVTTESEHKPLGGLLGTGSHLIYVPRAQMDDPEQLQRSISENKEFCWVLDLLPVFEGLLSALRPVIFEHLGFELEGPATSGVYRLTLLDGTKFEGESLEAVLSKLRRHRTKVTAGSQVASALSRAMRHRGIDPDVRDDMEDLARFVGYSDAAEFSEDIANVRKTLEEIALK